MHSLIHSCPKLLASDSSRSGVCGGWGSWLGTSAKGRSLIRGKQYFGTRTTRVWPSYRACRDEIERPEGWCLWARVGHVVGFGRGWGWDTWVDEEGWRREGGWQLTPCAPPTCSQMSKVPHSLFQGLHLFSLPMVQPSGKARALEREGSRKS